MLSWLLVPFVIHSGPTSCSVGFLHVYPGDALVKVPDLSSPGSHSVHVLSCLQDGSKFMFIIVADSMGQHPGLNAVLCLEALSVWRRTDVLVHGSEVPEAGAHGVRESRPGVLVDGALLGTRGGRRGLMGY